MRDLKLLEAAALAEIKLEEYQLDWDATKAALAAFRTNTTRMARLIEAPIYSAFTADANRLAIHRVFDGEPTPEKIAAANPEEIGRKVATVMGELINIGTANQRRALEIATIKLNEYIKSSGDVYTIFESFLSAVAIQAWTVFEVLAGDLLRRSVKLHPECFPHLSDQDTGKFKFQRRELIRRSYDKAFQSDVRINGLLNSECIDALALFRNLLVHNAGLVDERFQDECRECHLTAWSVLPIGKPVMPFDGDVLTRLVDPNIKNGFTLIKAADEWLNTHRPN